MNISWPEGILLTLAGIGILVAFVMDGDEKPQSMRNYNFSATVANTMIVGVLLYWGGFFA